MRPSDRGDLRFAAACDLTQLQTIWGVIEKKSRSWSRRHLADQIKAVSLIYAGPVIRHSTK